MLLTNPKIDGTTTSVRAILNAIPRKNPTKYTVDGTIPIPPWSSWDPFDSIEWHYQGVAPYNGNGGPTIANGCISASSTSGYFSGFSQEQGHNPGVRSVVVPDPNYYHAAGIQMLGDLLAVSLETSGSGNGKVAFYNVGQLASPSYLYTLTMPAKKPRPWASPRIGTRVASNSACWWCISTTTTRCTSIRRLPRVSVPRTRDGC